MKHICNYYSDCHIVSFARCDYPNLVSKFGIDMMQDELKIWLEDNCYNDDLMPLFSLRTSMNMDIIELWFYRKDHALKFMMTFK